ncbi:MAG: MotA/TolQ/ExbB proton channel family protein [Pirellulales bacterium]
MQSPAATPAPAASPDSFFEIVFSGGPIGIAIMLALIATSMLALYLVVEQILALRRPLVLPEGLGDRVRQCVQANQWAEAQQACRESPSMLGHVLFRGLAEADGGWNAVEEAIEESLAEHAARMFRRVEYLSVLANLAPMLGLLGTVFGMVLCFREVASTQGNAGAGQLAEGIYQALVTTVAGLIIAIPSLAAFALLRNRVDQFIAEAAQTAQHAFAPLKRRASAAPPTTPAVRPAPQRAAAAPPQTPTPPPAPPQPPAPPTRGAGG